MRSEAVHLPIHSVELRMHGTYLHTMYIIYVFTVWCLIKHRDNFKVTLRKHGGSAWDRLQGGRPAEDVIIRVILSVIMKYQSHLYIEQTTFIITRSSVLVIAFSLISAMTHVHWK
jgi:hypothetical protein